jgi:hypothetical protein
MRASARTLLPVPRRRVCTIITTHGRRRSNNGPLGDLKPSNPRKASGWSVFGGFDETGGFRTKQTLRLGYARIQESHCVRQDQ